MGALKNLLQTALLYSWRTGELRKLRRADVLLVCGDVDRGYRFEGKKYAQLLDSVNELLMAENLVTVTIADPYAKIIGSEAFGNVFSINGLIARATHFFTFLRRIRRDIPVQEIPTVKAWEKAIRRVAPSSIIGIQPSAELCIAAKNCGIWIADLQHGILSDEGYYGLHTRKRFNDQGWPDCVLCWDDASAQWLSKHLGNEVSVEKRVIGNPWFLRFIFPDHRDKLVDKAIKPTGEASGTNLVILVTLQWGLERTSLNHEIGIPHALMNVMKKNAGINWRIRIHPVQLRGKKGHLFLRAMREEFAGYDHISWSNSTENPLPIVLKQTDLHISIQSAVAIESAWFGIKTALLHPDTSLMYEYFKEQMDNGMVDTIAADEDIIASWIAEHGQMENGRKKKVVHFNKQWLQSFIADIKKRAGNK